MTEQTMHHNHSTYELYIENSKKLNGIFPVSMETQRWAINDDLGSVAQVPIHLNRLKSPIKYFQMIIIPVIVN